MLARLSALKNVGPYTLRQPKVRLFGLVAVEPPLQIAPAELPFRLFALLALRAGNVVELPTIIEALWGETLPLNHVSLAQGYVSKLRKGMPKGTIETVRGRSYRLNLQECDIDVLLCMRVIDDGCREALQGCKLTSLAMFEAALSLCQNQFMSECELTPPLQQWAETIENARRTAMLRRAEVALYLGYHWEILDEMLAEWLVDPLREDFMALLMVALYRCLRRVDACEYYRRMQRQLAVDLNMAPHPRLQLLYERVLRGDRALLLPTAAILPLQDP